MQEKFFKLTHALKRGLVLALVKGNYVVKRIINTTCYLKVRNIFKRY